MRQLLIINPNTSPAVSALLTTHGIAAAGPDVQVRCVTARFGAPYISDEASYAVATHATLDAWAAAIAGDGDETYRPDAVLIGCFGDPGLFALRESSPVRVTGLAEAAFVMAARHGRFAIVTGGERWKPMLQRLAGALGQGDALAGIHTVAPTGAQLAADPVWAQGLLAGACRDAAEKFGADAVILGGAGLAGMAAAMQSQVGVPLIDSVTAGAHWALHGEGAVPERLGAGFDSAWTRLSPEMQALGRPG